MLAQIVGIKKIDYLKDKGKDSEKRVLGLDLQIVRQPSRREHDEVTGSMVETCYIAGRDPIYSTVDFSKFMNQDVELEFEVDGKYKYLVGIELAEA